MTILTSGKWTVNNGFRHRQEEHASAAVALGVGEALDYTEEGADVRVVAITAPAMPPSAPGRT